MGQWRKFTPADDAALRRAYLNLVPVFIIARALGRSEKVIRQRGMVLKLSRTKIKRELTNATVRQLQKRCL